VQQVNGAIRLTPHVIYRCKPLLGLLLSLCFAGTVWPQESFTTHPPLPAGISSINVMDSKGRPVGRIPPQKRYWVSIDRIPSFLQKALLAVEDARFYEHNGIDYRGIARAAVTDVLRGKIVQGGSTITQQLIKNKYLNSAKTINRKLKEAEMALEFEKRYTKRQILEMYFNEIYFGNGAYGIAI
jgi:membrane peptidoglycan carboxypeptidase